MGQFLQVNGRRIHYVERGVPDGPAVLLLHGQSGFWYDWNEVIPALKDRYRVIALDHPGFGDSDWDPTGRLYQVGGFAGELQQVVRQLEMDRFTIIGHSFGGRIGLAYACAHPGQVRAVVLADSSPDVDPVGSLEARRYLASIPAAFTRWEDATAFFHTHYPNLEPAALRERLSNYLAPQPGGAWKVKRDPAIGARYALILQGQAQAPEPDWTTLRDCPCPVLLLRGSRSDLVTPAIAERMREENPRLEVREIRDAGHLVATEQPGQVRDVLREYLANLPQ